MGKWSEGEIHQVSGGRWGFTYKGKKHSYNRLHVAQLALDSMRQYDKAHQKTG